MDSAKALLEFLEFVVGQLIDSPELATISHEFTEANRKHFFKITLTSDDVGRLIGRNGQTVTSIRSLLNAAAARDGATVALKVVEHGHDEDHYKQDAEI